MGPTGPDRTAPSRPMPRRHALPAAIFAFALALIVAAPAFAQDSADLSPADRAAYAKSLREAATLVRERRFVEARVKLDDLVARRPREPQARFLIAVTDAEEGRAEAAIAGFESLTRDYPELPEPWNNLGALYLQRGDYEAARTALQTAVVAAPGWAVAHENLGDLHAALARNQYERAVALDRKNAAAAAKLELARELLAPPATGRAATLPAAPAPAASPGKP